jgi:hypothetical protein
MSNNNNNKSKVCSGCLNKAGIRSNLCKDCEKLRRSIFPMDSIALDARYEISLSDFHDVLNPTGKTPARISED